MTAITEFDAEVWNAEAVGSAERASQVNAAITDEIAAEHERLHTQNREDLWNAYGYKAGPGCTPVGGV